MPKVPQISDAEWLVMRTLWEQSPRTAAQITEALETQTGWKAATVKTLLSRLVEKKALKYSQEGKHYLYRPAVGEKDCARAEADSFLGRVFGGALTPMLAHFLEREDLSKEQIEQLRAVLDKAEKTTKEKKS